MIRATSVMHANNAEYCRKEDLFGIVYSPSGDPVVYPSVVEPVAADVSGSEFDVNGTLSWGQLRTFKLTDGCLTAIFEKQYLLTCCSFLSGSSRKVCGFLFRSCQSCARPFRNRPRIVWSCEMETDMPVSKRRDLLTQHLIPYVGEREKAMGSANASLEHKRELLQQAFHKGYGFFQMFFFLGLFLFDSTSFLFVFPSNSVLILLALQLERWVIDWWRIARLFAWVGSPH